MDIAVRLDMNLNRLRTCRGELLEIEIGTRHHQMDIPIEAGRDLAGECDDIGTERKIRHEMRVHDIEVKRLRSGRLGAANLVRQTSEVRSQQRRQYRYLHQALR